MRLRIGNANINKSRNYYQKELLENRKNYTSINTKMAELKKMKEKGTHLFQRLMDEEPFPEK